MPKNILNGKINEANCGNLSAIIDSTNLAGILPSEASPKILTNFCDKKMVIKVKNTATCDFKTSAVK